MCRSIFHQWEQRDNVPSRAATGECEPLARKRLSLELRHDSVGSNEQMSLGRMLLSRLHIGYHGSMDTASAHPGHGCERQIRCLYPQLCLQRYLSHIKCFN